MAQLQSQYAHSSGANDLSLIAGPTFASPFSLMSVLFQRQMGDAVDLQLDVVLDGRIYTIDKVLGMTENYYVFPNARVPHPIALDPKMRIQFFTEGTVSASEDQTVVIQWSQY